MVVSHVSAEHQRRQGDPESLRHQEDMEQQDLEHDGCKHDKRQRYEHAGHQQGAAHDLDDLEKRPEVAGSQEPLHERNGFRRHPRRAWSAIRVPTEQ